MIRLFIHKKFFDTVSSDLIVRAIEALTDCRWVLLYVKRWLAAPLQRPNGVLSAPPPTGGAGLTARPGLEEQTRQRLADCSFPPAAAAPVVH